MFEKQSQRSGDASVNLQALRDINLGLGYSDVKQIAEDTFDVRIEHWASKSRLSPPKEEQEFEPSTALSAAVINSTNKEAIANYNEAVDLQDAGDSAGALTVFKQAIDEGLESWHAYIRYGNALRDEGNLDAAIDAYNNAIQNAPEEGRIRNNLGLAYKSKGDLDSAIAEYYRGITLSPEWAILHYNLAQALTDKEQYKEAAHEYKLAIMLEPNDEAFHYNYAFLLAEHLNDQEGAIIAAREALNIDPEYSEARYGLGLTLARTGKVDEAIDVYYEIINRHPDNTEVYNDLGLAFSRKGDEDKAIECYLKATEKNPQHYKAFSNLGDTYLNRGLKQQAIEAFRSSVLINPSWPYSHYGLACAHALSGNSSASLASLSIVIQLKKTWQEYATQDSKLEGIREKQNFKDIVNADEARRRRDEIRQSVDEFNLDNQLTEEQVAQLVDRIIDEEDTHGVSAHRVAIHMALVYTALISGRLNKYLPNIAKENDKS